MFKRDQWDEILESLSSNWFRTIMTAFGVFWGIFILVILLAAGNGLGNGVKSVFDGLATNSMFMWSQPTSISYKGMNKGRRYSFKLGDVEAIKRNVDGLSIVSPRNRLGGFGGNNNVQRGLKNGAFNVYGDYPEIIKQQPMDITSGRFINHIDIDQERKVAVIGFSVVNELFSKDEDPLGHFIKINGVNFQVIGVYEKKGMHGQDPEEASKEIIVPFTAYGKAFHTGEDVSFMSITADDNHTITELKQEVFEVIKNRHQIAPEDNRAIGNFDLYEQFKKINGLVITLNAVAYFVGILVLISGIIGISNIMLIVVKERTNEIGVRRALGASPWAIKSQVLSESVFLTIISGMAGISFATGVLWIANRYLDNVESDSVMFSNPSVGLGAIITALMILVVSGLLAGFIPAQNAIKIKPVDALRTE